MKKTQVLLIGTGQMAYEYSKVLKAQGYDFVVVGRGEASAKIFQEKTGIKPITGGADKFLANTDHSDWKAIVAVTIDQLGKVTLT
ncbi:MAG: gfo/Idh/MocA family oxidoreductase, partial [Candidatus Daviesbacteria bacterium]|nr:gfo/Idh/MocA family oxidoreductase [Candidatus Daviesbacteria bacterium]